MRAPTQAGGLDTGAMMAAVRAAHSAIHDCVLNMQGPRTAGLGCRGAKKTARACTSLRVSFSSSRSDSWRGSTVMPPFAPPKGMSITAVFHVIRLARLRSAAQVSVIHMHHAL